MIMATIDKKELRLAIVVLTATAYFTIFYDIFRDGLKLFVQNNNVVICDSGNNGFRYRITCFVVSH